MLLSGRCIARVLMVSTLLVATGCASPPPGDAAEAVYTNGKIYTVDDTRPWAEVLDAAKEKLTVDQAIRAYTLDAAYAVEAESYSGSLEPGKRADFIVLDRNLLEIPEDEIVGTQVLKTVLDGRVVYEKD